MSSPTAALDRILLLLAQAAAALVLALPIAGLLIALLRSGILSEEFPATILPLGVRPLGLLLRSVAFSIAVAAFSSVAGALIAWGAMGARRGAAVLSLILPPLLIVPISIHGLNWATLILQLNDWGMRHAAPMQISGWLAAWLAEVLSFLPLAIGIAWTGFALLDRQLLEAAMVFRAPRSVLLKITAPLAGLVLAAGCGLIFLLSLSDYTVPSLFAVSVYSMEIFSAYSASSHPAGAILTALPMMAIISLAMAGMWITGFRSRHLLWASASGPWPCRAAAWYAGSALSLLVLLLAVPMASLAVGAGSPDGFFHAIESARSELLVSLKVSSATAVLALLLGIGVARGMMRGRAAWLWWALACLLFAMPAPLVAIGLLQVASHAGAWMEPCLPVWACLARFLPVAAFICYAVFQRMDQGLLEAAGVFQRTRLHGALWVVLPLAWRGLFLAAATCLALALGELGASLLVAPPGESPLVVRLYNLLHYGASQEVASLGLALSLIALGAGLLLTTLMRQQNHRTKIDSSHA
jgi:iron(III) transport system permease protein